MSAFSGGTLRAAFAFFTRIPVGRPLPPKFRGVAAWLPVVGLVVGLLAGLATWLAARCFPPGLCGVLGCLAWVAVTGGLHLDGVADCGDGLWVEASPARRLEIMRDSRLGTFGGAALFFVLAVKAAALAAVADGTLPELIAACGSAGLFARSAVFLLMRQASARPGGLGEALREGVGPAEERMAAGFAAVACLVSAAMGLHGLLAAGVVLAWTWGLARAARQRLGGVTGDVFGCLVESAECAALLVFAIAG